MSNYKWKPIERITSTDQSIDLAAMHPLYQTWEASKSRLGSEDRDNLQEFQQRLVRRISIETGILEHLYDLDRGTTEALVAKGFIEDLVSRSSTDIKPSHLIDILKDHEAAIQLVIDCIAGSRQLTKSVIHQLHQILTSHQETTTAVDQFGMRMEIPLTKGHFKIHPNNPRRPDGSIHEYCPPIHVESEMDNLLTWFDKDWGKDPIILAAWFHHRFTQIHPYQDGNGRVARALTSLVLLKAELLPLVLDRDLRIEYIEALEEADQGDLTALARLFARLERAAISQALSVDPKTEISLEKSVTSAVVQSLANKFGKRRAIKVAELRQVNTRAVDLRNIAHSSLSRAVAGLEQALMAIAQPDAQVIEGGSDKGNGHWYKFEVVRSANEAGKFANFTEDHYFVKASMRANRERLVFVVSFHHIGRELSGIMEATAFAKLESFEESEDRKSVSQEFRVCSIEPFVFTYLTNESEIVLAFDRWLDGALAVAVKEYGDRL